jgi:uncharacterized protein YycO
MEPLLKRKKKKSFSGLAIKSASTDSPNYDWMQYMPSSPQDPVVAVHAMVAGASPKILDKAKQSLGNKDFIGLCEKFIEQVTQGKSGLFQSAVAAWDHYTKSGQASPGLTNAKAGDMIYFAPDKSNHNYGHVGLLDSGGNLISATNSGVKSIPLQKWTEATGQKVLGVVKP